MRARHQAPGRRSVSRILLLAAAAAVVLFAIAVEEPEGPVRTRRAPEPPSPSDSGSAPDLARAPERVSPPVAEVGAEREPSPASGVSFAFHLAEHDDGSLIASRLCGLLRVEPAVAAVELSTAPDFARWIDPWSTRLSAAEGQRLLELHRPMLEALAESHEALETERQQAFRRRAETGFSEALELLDGGPTAGSVAGDRTARFPAPRLPGEAVGAVSIGSELRAVRLSWGDDPVFDALRREQQAEVELLMTSLRESFAVSANAAAERSWKR